ncbi:MAG TPA: type II toxin-antitoxin system PemK/MazF family toxin [Candidatus Andersenbacteria bacterium]|nr:type II toxin-antitoxin system PemK/MazF family toxin [Candidatus Andersenbacteria bacterium]
MKKDFSAEYDAWNDTKKSLAKRQEKFFFKTGDIWWCSLGLNIGTESYGKGETFRRPILILKKLSGNACIAIPLTSKEKTGTWFQEITLHGEKKWVMLNQIRMIHSNRFQRRMAVLDDRDFKLVKQKLEALLELSDNHHLA